MFVKIREFDRYLIEALFDFGNHLSVIFADLTAAIKYRSNSLILTNITNYEGSSGSRVGMICITKKPEIITSRI